MDFKTKGNECFKAQQYMEAVNWYSKAIEQDLTNETLYSNRAASYSALGKHAQALEDAEKCISLKPNWVKGHFRKGVALFKLGKFDEAVVAYSRAHELDIGNEDIQSKLNEARAEVKKMGTKNPSRVHDPLECKTIGNTRFKEGAYDDAARWYSRGIELTQHAPTDDTAILYTNRASCHAQIRNQDGVIADCTEAIKINPNYCKAFLRRALAFEASEKWQKAADDFKRALELEPGAVEASKGFQRCNKFARELL